MKLRCVGKYVNDVRNLRFEVGEEFEADGELLQFLQSDAPGCFEEVVEEEPKPKGKALKRPPRNKAVDEAPEDK